MLDKLLAKRRGMKEITHGEFRGDFTPYQQSVFLASFSDESHQNYLIHLQLKLSRLYTRGEVVSLFQKLFAATPALGLRVIENEEGFRLEKGSFENKEISYYPLEAEGPKVSIPVTAPSLFRIDCYESSEMISMIRLTLHHLLIDGTSIEILRRRFAQLIEGQELDLDERYEMFAIECKQKEAYLRKRANEFALKALRSDFSEILPHTELVESKSHGNYPLQLEGLDEFCKLWQITRPGILYGCLALALSAVTRNRKINLGTVAENRGPKDADAIGCFINTTLLTYDFSQLERFSSLIEASRSIMLEMLDTSDVPFVYIREEMQRFGWSKDQLFQVFVNYLQAPDEKVDAHFDLSLLPSNNNKFDLNVTFQEGKNGLSLCFEGKLSKSKEWVDALVMIFHRALSSCLKKPEASLRSADLFGVPALHGPVSLQRNLLLEEFERNLSLAPEKLFIISSQIEMTYQEAGIFSDRVCQRLQELNLPIGGRVGVMLDRSPYFIPTCLGIWKAGGSYVPIDVRLNPQRKADILDSSALSCLIGLDQDPEIQHADLWLDEIGCISAHPDRSLGSSSHQEAYVLFTSGSTGRPKGVSVSHGNIAHYAHSLGEYLAPETLRGLTFGVVSTPAADLGNTSIFLALLYGGTIAQFSYEEVLDAEVFQGLLQRFGVDVLKIVPSHFKGLFLNETSSALPRKMIIFGGEKLDSEMVRKLRSLKPDLRLCNHYGPTETTVGVFCREIHEVPDVGYIPMGKPFGMTQVAVVDHEKRFLPLSLAGELIVYGPSVSLGYINGTGAAFGTDDFGAFYQTGDIVQSKKGEFFYQGREDDQLKINGVRVDLSELDEALRKIAGLSKFHILPHASGLNVFHTDSLQMSEERLKQQLSWSINILLVPSRLIQLEQIPVGPNGKVDKQTLVALLEELQESSETDLMIEMNPKVREIWEQTIGPLRSPHDTVFQSGGSSLVAARILSRLNREFRRSIPLGQFLKTPTALYLSQLLSSPAEVQTGESLLSTELTAFQRRMWYINRLNPLDPSYNVPLLLELRNTSRASELSGFFRQIFQHFDTLQSRFQEVGNEVRVIFDDNFASVYSFCSQNELEETYALALKQGMDLLIERPFRIFHSPDKILILFHHIITDGQSNKFLIELLDIFLTTGAINLSAYPKRLRHLRPTVTPSETNFWKEQLLGFAPLDLSLQKTLPDDGPSSLEIHINDDVRGSIYSWCEFNGVFPKDYFLGLLTVATSYVFNTPRFYQLTAINTRQHEDDYHTLGASIDTLLFGIEVLPEETFTNFIKRVKKTFWDFHHNSSVSFGDQLQYHKLLSQDGSLIPNYMFAFESSGQRYVNITSATTPKLAAKFPLALTVFEDPHGLRIELSSMEKLLATSTLNRMVRVIQNLLDHSLHSDCEIQQLPFSKGLEVCQYKGPEAQGALLLEAFKLQCRRNPSAVCVFDSTHSLSFEQVRRASDELAAKLFHIHGRNKLIGVHLARSTSLIVSILAVLKSGSAFIPIDKSTPATRLTQVFAEVDLVLNEEFLKSLDDQAIVLGNLPAIDPEDIAYCIFTSGSTGKPKAVPISHRSIGNYLQCAEMEYLGNHPGPIPLISSLNYDLTVTTYLLPLFSGRACRIFNSEDTLSLLNEFSQTTEDWSMVKMTPSHLRIIKDQLMRSKMKIKSLILGGEGLESGLLSGLHLVETFFNEYGPAETTIGVTVHKFTLNELQQGPCPIGKPFTNTVIELRGFLNLPVVPLTKGRLIIRGVQVFEGYRGDSRPTNGVYDSGDLAFEADGNIFYIGRDDGQIKISGNRIEITEMRLILKEFFPFMEFQLEVIMFHGQQMVVLIWEEKPQESLLSEAKRQFLKAYPPHLLPERFVSKSDICVLDSGKTDWESTLLQSDSPKVPAGDLKISEEMIAGIWKRVLHLENPDRDLNFFDAGGTSLSLVRLLAEIKLIALQSVTIVDLLRLTTIRQQSSLLEDNSADDTKNFARTRKRVDMRKRN